MALTFTGKCTFDIDLGVRFEAFDGEKRVPCSVSAEALQDAEGMNSFQGDDLVAAYKAHAEDIHLVAERKYRAGAKQADGSSVVVTTADLNT